MPSSIHSLPVGVPRVGRVRANGLWHRVLYWDVAAARGCVVLAHGYLDNAWSFAWVADALNARGYSVVAFDFRGHGESERVSAGGYYHFSDYLLDLHELMPQITGSGDYHLVGHSMGGTACALFASLLPPRLQTLTLLEGVGPDDTEPKQAALRLRRFIESVGKVRARPERSLLPVQAAERLRLTHAELSVEASMWLADKSTRPLADGRVEFAFDPLHQTTSAVAFREDTFCEALTLIEVPTLVVQGTRGYCPAGFEQRVRALRNATQAKLQDVSHMMHWFAPERVAQLIIEHIQTST